MDKLSYALGLTLGQQLGGVEANVLNFIDLAQGIEDMLCQNEPKIDLREAQQVLQKYFTELEAKMSSAAKEEGAKFLAENAKKAGVKTTASGLQYEVLDATIGQKPKATDRVKVHYEGKLLNGTIFDSSYRRGEPITFALNQVIAGWTEGVQLMSVGSKYRFYIPYNLAYGENGAGRDIPPYATLIFTVELLGIE